MKTSTLCANDGWRTRYRQEHPDTGRSQGTAITKAWSNSRDAGEILGVTARLHPQLRRCINALDLPEPYPAVMDVRWFEHIRRSNVPDGLVIRHSADNPIPLWGHLMRAKRLRLRLAVIGWSQGLTLETVQDLPIRYWEDFLGVEQARERMVRSGKPRDVKERLERELTRLQEEAARAPIPHPDPRSGLPGHSPREWSVLDEKYRNVPLMFPDDGIQRTGLSREMLSQGWHLVAPEQTLGWMVAQTVLGDTRRKATCLGRTHLGLNDGFRSADRARFFTKLSRQHRDLATLTLQRITIRALADLGVVPGTITDAGIPIQTLLLGRHEERDCCVLICGEHLRVWYRSGATWGSEPGLLMRLPDDFAMVILGEDAVALEGVRKGGRRSPIAISQLQLHTFPRTPATFPANAWARRTGLAPVSVIPSSRQPQRPTSSGG